MSHPLSKAFRGDRVSTSATAHNAMVDAARAERSRKFGSGRRLPLDPIPSGLVSVKNDGGVAVPRFGILAIAGVVFGPDDNLASFKNEACLRGVVPSESYRNFVVTREPLAPGAIGSAVVHGITPVTLSVGSEEYDFAHFSSSTEHLFLAPSGDAEVLWREGGSGLQWAVIRMNARGD